MAAVLLLIAQSYPCRRRALKRLFQLPSERIGSKVINLGRVGRPSSGAASETIRSAPVALPATRSRLEQASTQPSNPADLAQRAHSLRSEALLAVVGARIVDLQLEPTKRHQHLQAPAAFATRACNLQVHSTAQRSAALRSTAHQDIQALAAPAVRLCKAAHRLQGPKIQRARAHLSRERRENQQLVRRQAASLQGSAHGSIMSRGKLFIAQPQTEHAPVTTGAPPQWRQDAAACSLRWHGRRGNLLKDSKSVQRRCAACVTAMQVHPLLHPTNRCST